MKIHRLAKLTPRGREQMVKGVAAGKFTPREAAASRGVSLRTVFKWLKRYRSEGLEGLEDRSCRPLRLRAPTPEWKRQRVIDLRRQRLTGQRIARELGISRATVSRILARAGLRRLKDLEPPPPPNSYEHKRPGDLLHLDTKKLARFRQPGHRVTGNRRQNSDGIGYDFVHVGIDDHSRVAFARVHPDERHRSAVSFLHEAVSHYRSMGVRIRRVLTDNGSCYVSRAFRAACQRLRLRHSTTQPYRPRTNGKAERFIQTALREWAYAASYATSHQRNDLLPRWLHSYNWHRPHASLDHRPPASRLHLPVNNLPRLHT